jgi:PhnB protein
MQVAPYLLFDGDCRQAFEFYQQCLGGNVHMIDWGIPEVADHAPDHWREKILHARLQVGSTMLMGSDGRPGETVSIGGFSVSLSVEDPVEAERLFSALSEGGSVTMPIGPTFWALRFGMLADRFSVAWMVNCEKAA